MIVIFSNENDLSTIDVAKRLKQMKQDVIIIEPDTAENMLIGIDNEKILFKNIRTGRVFNILNASATWWRRSGLGMKNFTKSLPDKFIVDEHDLSALIHGSKSIAFMEMNDLVIISLQHCTNIVKLK